MEKYRMIEPEEVVIAGISGGADSVCLLFVLLEIQKKIPFSLEAVHVNHGVRPEAAEDARYVEELCRKNSIPCHLTEADMKATARELSISQEEAGRKIRYQAFEEALGGRRGRIAVAHNSNDRAETMLFHLFRGTGLTGASGIRPVNGRIIRPLLCVQRKEIEKWLAEREISYCRDSTNEQDIYTRNRIRHHILTYAQKEICRGAVANMSRTADQLLEAEEFAEKQTLLAMKSCVAIEEDQGRALVELPKFLEQEEYLQGRILLSCIEQVCKSRKDITQAHIDSVKRLFAGSGSKELHLPYGIFVYKKYDLGMIQKKSTNTEQTPEAETKREEYEVKVPSSLEISALGNVEISMFLYENSQDIPEKTYTKWFDYDKITSSVMFRTRKSGDYLTVNSRMGHKSLQDYLVNEKIPKSERDRLFLLAEGSHILWIPGMRISEYYKVSDQTKRILQVKICKDEKIRRKEL